MSSPIKCTQCQIYFTGVKYFIKYDSLLQFESQQLSRISLFYYSVLSSFSVPAKKILCHYSFFILSHSLVSLILTPSVFFLCLLRSLLRSSGLGGRAATSFLRGWSPWRGRVSYSLYRSFSYYQRDILACAEILLVLRAFLLFPILHKHTLLFHEPLMRSLRSIVKCLMTLLNLGTSH